MEVCKEHFDYFFIFAMNILFKWNPQANLH